MQEKTTIDDILKWVEEKVENKIPLAPSVYLDLAHKMTALMGNLDDSLIEARMAVNRMIGDKMVEGESAAKSKMLAEMSPEYENYLKLEAKRERAAEFIRLAKKRVELQSFDQ